jgi:hypothetical protein
MREVIYLVVYYIDETGNPHFYIANSDEPVRLELAEGAGELQVIQEWLQETFGASCESPQPLWFEGMTFTLCEIPSDKAVLVQPYPNSWLTNNAARDSVGVSGKLHALIHAAHNAIPSSS